MTLDPVAGGLGVPVIAYVVWVSWAGVMLSLGRHPQRLDVLQAVTASILLLVAGYSFLVPDGTAPAFRVTLGGTCLLVLLPIAIDLIQHKRRAA